jgi:two-component system, NtrC family, response regulator GlrR
MTTTVANAATRPLAMTSRARHVAQFSIEVVSGPDAGQRAVSDGIELAIGTNPGNHLVLTDGAVSRHHCQIVVEDRGFLLRDLGSTNGTELGSYRILAAYLAPGATIRVGQSTLQFELTATDVVEPLADATAFGGVIGRSPAMRRLFFVLERAIATDVAILLEGETGTGKSILAEAMHEAGPRAKRPFVVVDCGAISASLIESELFGHERGAFTGAVEAKQGMFEAANGGTILLDEIGELPLDLQPKLLRVLESRTVTRIGMTRPTKLDLRIIAATNRDLRTEVNANRFRADLFYRISTLRVRVPPLRERPEDIPQLAEAIYREIVGSGAAPPVGLLAPVARHTWPGNVRELRNFIERSVVLGPQLPDRAPAGDIDDDSGLSFREAKARATQLWERRWLERLLRDHDGNLTQAARTARTDRNYLRDLLHRYGLQARTGPDPDD